jgi:hypothetical protein
MDHVIVKDLLLWVVVAVGVMSILQFFLTHLGEFLRFWKKWKRTL